MGRAEDAAPAAEDRAPAPFAAEDAALARHLDALRERFPLPTAEELAPRRPRVRKAAAAALVLALLAALIGLDPAYRSAHHQTGIGERREVVLADGSRVMLDSNSRIDVSWHLRTRKVALPSGRAMFEVEPATWRPFEVAAGDTTVRVVGTAFDVMRQNTEVAVTVLSGIVDVRGRDGEVTRLVAGDRVRSEAGQLGTPDRPDVDTLTAWKDGRLVFDRTPLHEVLAQVRRYSLTPVELGGDARLAQMEVTGVFAIDNAGAMLGLLPRVLPVRVVALDGGGVRIEPGGPR